MPLTQGLSIPIIVGAAVVDSINPCAFGVLIFILAYMFKVAHQKAKVIADGIGYVIGVYLTYLFLGVLIYMAIGSVLEPLRASGILSYAYQAIGALMILAGLLELKDFLHISKGPSLSIFPAFAEKVKQWTSVVGDKAAKDFKVGMFMAVCLGFLVALVELPCTGAPYLAVITLLTQSGFSIGQ